MEPFVALVVGFVVARVLGWIGVDALDNWQAALKVGLAVMLLFTAVAHFHPRLRPEIVEMVPPSLPRPDLLVSLTGVLEIAGAIGLLIPATSTWAAVGIILLLIALWPANVSAARRKVAQGDPIGPRSAFQLVYIAAAALTII
ncbi:DoxX family protein [Streptomyces albipurpureus]|uniref:DoxX family protein n=1 Tax=Streptomyces albipurpureus TaxID=2897419 RepID=A0ABT0UZG3_9ACTN|nr:DoxX family protein [Streptomyces sp. CWNU-1]MCM2392546.1 DoxX family protein [Streptomyces sp. CWNU-1]